MRRWPAALFGALWGRRLAIPDDLPSELLPEGVVLREGRLVPWIGGLMARMRSPAAAVTLGRTIIFYPGVPMSRRLLVHELEHVRQWRSDRLFPLRYTLESLRHGYRNNRFEVEARAAESDAHGGGNA